MDLSDIIRAIQSGVSDEELVKLLNQFRRRDPEGFENALSNPLVQDLSESQFERLEQGFNEFFVDIDFLGEEAMEQLEGLAPFLGGAAGAQTAGRLTEGFTQFGRIGSLAPGASKAAQEVLKKNPNLLRQVIGFLGRHPRATQLGTLGIGAGAAVSFFGGVEETGPGGAAGPGVQITPSEARGVPLTPGEQPTSDTDSGFGSLKVKHGFNVMVIDRDGSMSGTPGTVVVLRPEDLDAALGKVSPGQVEGILQQAATQGGQSAVDAIIADVVAASTSGIGTNAVRAGLVQPVASIMPQTVGVVNMPTPAQTVGGTFPQEILARGQDPEGNLTREGQRFIEINVGPGDLPDQQGVTVPAGAEIAPRVFNEHNGRPLLEWASIIAQQVGVPLNLLYGIVDHESNWNPRAVGDSGNSFGLAQIYMPVWGGSVSKGQALNPVFALRWAAQNLKNNRAKYGSWEAAVAAHNSPVAAQYLARTGNFLNKKSASYVSSVLGRANNSGISDDIYRLDPDATIGSAGSKATYTPYQGLDPDQSREFVLQTYQDMLGRKPTEAEYAREVARLEALNRQAYSANLRQAKGGTSQAVDIESSFREGIRETGEFAFTEDTHELDSFTNFTAGVARLLQQGL